MMQNKEFLARLEHFSSHSEPGYSGHGRNLGRQRFAGATKNTPQRYSFEAPPICTELGFTMFTPKYLLKPRTNKSCSSISKSRCIFPVLLTAVTNNTSAKTASSQSFFHICTAAYSLGTCEARNLHRPSAMNSGWVLHHQALQDPLNQVW